MYRQQLDDESSGDDEWVDDDGKKQTRKKIPLHHTVKNRTKPFAPKGITSRNLKDINGALRMKQLNMNAAQNSGGVVMDGPSPFPVSSSFSTGKDVMSPTFNPQADPDKIVKESTDSTVASAAASSASASQATTPALVPQIVGNQPISEDLFLAAVQHQRGPDFNNAAAKWKPKKKLTPEEEEEERKKISAAAKEAAKTAKEIAMRFRQELEQDRNNAAASAPDAAAAPTTDRTIHLDGFSTANPEGRSLTPMFGVQNQAPPPPPGPPKEEPNAAPSVPWLKANNGATPEYD